MNYLPENKEAIKYIGNLPEHGWLDICDTDDRVGAFYFVRDFYRLIADRLQDFFKCSSHSALQKSSINKA